MEGVVCDIVHHWALSSPGSFFCFIFTIFCLILLFFGFYLFSLFADFCFFRRRSTSCLSSKKIDFTKRKKYRSTKTFHHNKTITTNHKKTSKTKHLQPPSYISFNYSFSNWRRDYLK